MRAITLLLLAFVLVAGAATVTLQPDGAVGKDTFTNSANPTVNYGTHSSIAFGMYSAGSYASFIEFTELDDAQYQGATVNSAFLYLYCWEAQSPGQYLIGPCNALWDEYTITWDTMVGVHETNPPSYPSGTGWIMYGVSDWVQNWLDGTWNNDGFAIFDNDGSSQYVIAYSSDYTDDSTLRPKLYLDYTPGAAVEEATWGQIKVGI